MYGVLVRGQMLAIALGFALVSTEAPAAQAVAIRGPESVRVIAPSGCVDGLALEDHLYAELELDIPPGLQILVWVTKDGQDAAGYVLLEGDVVRARRTLESPPSSCERLQAALAVSIAMAIESLAVDPKLQEPLPLEEARPVSVPGFDDSTPARVQECPVERTPPADPPIAVSSRGLRSHRWGLAGGGVVAASVIAPLGFGGFLTAIWIRGRFNAALRLTTIGGLRLPTAPGEVRAWAAAAEPQACLASLSQQPWVRVCGGMRVGALRARGHGFARPRQSTTLWASGTAGAELVLGATQRLGFVLGSRMVLPIRRPRFVFGERTVSSPPLGVEFDIGVHFGWGR